MSAKIKIKIINRENVKEQFYCTICEYPIASKEDFILVEKYNCCNNCYLQFIEARRPEWKAGWRPKQDLIDSYIKKRKLIYENIGDKSEF